MNRSFEEEIFPDIWKIANVIPIFKKGDNSQPSNYRPVALLNCIGKLQERIVLKTCIIFYLTIIFYVSIWLLTSPVNSFFFQLIDIFQNICQAFDNNILSCIVFCDVSKSFDRVWHKGLLFKLQQNDIEGKFLEWLSSYLSQRKQKVGLKSRFSGLKSIFAGVSQGSVLGALLFLVYINEIAEHLLSLTRLFADDSSLFYSAAHIDDKAGIINHDMQLLSNCARQWLVTFNPLKTEAVLFTLKKINILPQLIFDNIPINFVDNHKHIDATFSSTGQWHSHIENIVLSATKVLGKMLKLKYPISTNTLNQMYMSFLLPVVEYVSVVWGGCSEQDSQALKKTKMKPPILLQDLLDLCH